MVSKLKILLLFLLLTSGLQAQVSEYEYKAAFLERFTRFIEWPEKFENDTFRIAIIGENPFENSLDELISITKIKNRNAEIIYTNNINDLSFVNLVFIAGSEKKRMRDIISVINDKPILIISDTEKFSEMGTHINMYIEGNYIRYEMNQKALEKAGLEVSSLLFASAKIVETNE